MIADGPQVLGSVRKLTYRVTVACHFASGVVKKNQINHFGFRFKITLTEV